MSTAAKIIPHRAVFALLLRSVQICSFREPHVNANPNSYIGDFTRPPIPTETATFASPLQESLRWKEREKGCRAKNLCTYLRRSCSKTRLSVVAVVLLCFVAFPTTIALLLFSKNQRRQSNDLSGSRLILPKFTLTKQVLPLYWKCERNYGISILPIKLLDFLYDLMSNSCCTRRIFSQTLTN
uniref:Uncharacterized protein n=1 Tax=Ascaris lumbricoides TaxID=6252 RepID=A0A0M3HNU5_ASCLU